MSRNTIIALIHHRHKGSDLVYDIRELKFGTVIFLKYFELVFILHLYHTVRVYVPSLTVSHLRKL
jgi:hypothetical protein